MTIHDLRLRTRPNWRSAVRAATNGVRLGRKPTLTHHQQPEAIKRVITGKETVGEIARSRNVSCRTISGLAV
jgi:hypothetical protein